MPDVAIILFGLSIENQRGGMARVRFLEEAGITVALVQPTPDADRADLPSLEDVIEQRQHYAIA